MGVATRGTAGRWAVAATLATAVGLAPTAYARLPVADPARSPRDVVAAALRSATVAHTGLVETTGTLGLPDLPRLGAVAALLGSTTRARVWWRSTTAWRVDRITTTGESGLYAVPGGVRTWDFETGRAERQVGVTPVRLPRVDDLLPPQAVRRALAGVTRRDRVAALPARRVAGRTADGVRVRPAASASTIGHLDVYVDRATGLPLSMVVVPRGSNVAAVRTTFVEVALGRPEAAALRPRTPPFARVRTTETADLASAVDRYAPFALPDSLGGLPRSRALVGGLGGSATYGRGLARYVVLPLPPRTGRSALEAAMAGGGVDLAVPGAETALVSTPLLNALLVAAEPRHEHPFGRRGRWYLLTGTVDRDTLQAAAEDLVGNPPGLR